MLSLAEKLGVLAALIAWPVPFVYGVLLLYDPSQYQPYGGWLVLLSFVVAIGLSIGVGLAIAKVGNAIWKNS